jgi:hypothetical protein
VPDTAPIRPGWAPLFRGPRSPPHRCPWARRLDVRVIEVDGTRDAAAVADLVAEHWPSYLS